MEGDKKKALVMLGRANQGEITIISDQNSDTKRPNLGQE